MTSILTMLDKIANGDTETVRSWIKQTPPEELRDAVETYQLVSAAVAHGARDLVDDLIERAGVDFHCINSEGFSLGGLAAANDDAPMLRQLIRAGFDPARDHAFSRQNGGVLVEACRAGGPDVLATVVTDDLPRRVRNRPRGDDTWEKALKCAIVKASHTGNRPALKRLAEIGMTPDEVSRRTSISNREIFQKICDRNVSDRAASENAITFLENAPSFPNAFYHLNRLLEDIFFELSHADSAQNASSATLECHRLIEALANRARENEEDPSFYNFLQPLIKVRATDIIDHLNDLGIPASATSGGNRKAVANAIYLGAIDVLDHLYRHQNVDPFQEGPFTIQTQTGTTPVDTMTYASHKAPDPDHVLEYLQRLKETADEGLTMDADERAEVTSGPPAF